MASASHDLLVLALREDPALLRDLVERLRGDRIPPGLSPDDSAVRFANSSEVRPDLVLRGPKGSWVLVEIQLRIDPSKCRRWTLAAAIMFDQRRVMGDLVVITTSRAVARWAGRAARARGPLGTRLLLQPVVVSIDDRELDRLLDESRPALALFAVLAVRRRRGARARAVLARALEVTRRLDEPLRANQTRAILNMIGDEMSAFLRKLAEHPEIMPLSKGYREFERILMARGRAEGRAEGEAAGRAAGRAEGKKLALLALCAARGLRLDAAQRSRILACRDPRTLERWIRRAAVAQSPASVLAATRPSRRRASNGPERRRSNARRDRG